MRFGSLFSGIGGLDLGLERAGMSCAWQVEYDDFCTKLLAKHWPDVPRFGDIKEIDPRDLATVDLICGGFPCQPVSVAGKRKAQADDRWLWPEFARLVRHLRPRYVLVENVPGLLTANEGRAAQEVFGDLAELGFDAEWASVPAAAVGAPHLRYRLFIVAYAVGQQLRVEPGRSGGSDGEGPALAGVDGPALAVADAHGTGPQGGRVFGSAPERGDWWAVEPDVGRVADGVPARVDRLRSLGNAVVPQVAEWVGRQILRHDRGY